MGRGVALLRFVSLGPRQQFRLRQVASSDSLRLWLEDQLHMRGVDSKLYSRYILSLLQLDNDDFEPEEGGLDRGTRQALHLVPGEERRKLAALRCLQSACVDPYEVDALVDELCYRLQRLPEHTKSGSSSDEAEHQQQPPVNSDDDAYLSAFPPLRATNNNDQQFSTVVDDDDVISVCSSEGSDILNLVNQILLSFNSEVSEGTAVLPDSLSDQFCNEGVWPAFLNQFWSPNELVPSSSNEERRRLHTLNEEVSDMEYLEPYVDTEDALSDHDFDYCELDDNNEDVAVDSQEGSFTILDLADQELDSTLDDDVDHDDIQVNESETTAAATVSTQTDFKPRLTATTGHIVLSEQEVLQRMENWGPLDVARHELWSSSSRPPISKPEPVVTNNSTGGVRPQRACSFLLRGHCKKEDCEFAHDLSQVTCKFWSSGECFKGATCPFFHGYANG